MSDPDLVRRCLRGDPAAMRQLVDRFQPDVFALCVRLLRHRQDAEDVAQETFLRVFRSLGRWDSARPLRPWVLAIAVNRCRTCIGRRGRVPDPTPFVDEVPARREADPPGELTAGIRAAVDDLRADYREVFVLFHEQGQSYEAIAGAVGRPVGTVKTWLHRARAVVLDHLQRQRLVPDEPSTEPEPSPRTLRT